MSLLNEQFFLSHEDLMGLKEISVRFKKNTQI